MPNSRHPRARAARGGDPSSSKLDQRARARRRQALRRRRAVALGLVALVVLAAVLATMGGGAQKHIAKTRIAAKVWRVPPLVNTNNVYAADFAGNLSPVVRRDPSLVYVPNSLSNTVQVIDPNTYKVIREFPVPTRPQHVVPSYDLKTLYAASDVGGALTPISPATGTQAGSPIPVPNPYNLYFTPDGHYAIDVSEIRMRLYFLDPHTMKVLRSLPVPTCPGIDHADFSADGRYMYASCEAYGKMIEVDLQQLRVLRTLDLQPKPASPQDVKLSPDGKLLYVADQDRNGLWEIDPQQFRVVGFLPTGSGAHGLYPSRDARFLYVSNRTAGTISVIDFATRRIVHTWSLGPSSPDMGGVSNDGKTLWLSGRYSAVVYAINTATGELRATIHVGKGPHGLCVWPQPGRYSLGHTGILR
jgi:YVTN family beta-propeller protein